MYLAEEYAKATHYYKPDRSRQLQAALSAAIEQALAVQPKQEPEALKPFETVWRWTALKDGKEIYQYSDKGAPSMFSNSAVQLPTQPQPKQEPWGMNQLQTVLDALADAGDYIESDKHEALRQEAIEIVRQMMQAEPVEPMAAVVEVRRTNGPWQRYDVYSALTVAMDTKMRVEGDGIEARVIPLYQATQVPIDPFEKYLKEGWTEMVTVNLVREGVNKHKARELAQHFYMLAAAPKGVV